MTHLTLTAPESHSRRMNTNESELTLLDQKQAARILGVSTAAMEWWRAHDEGPPWFRVGRKLVRYHPRALRAWIEAQAQAAGVKQRG